MQFEPNFILPECGEETEDKTYTDFIDKLVEQTYQIYLVDARFVTGGIKNDVFLTVYRLIKHLSINKDSIDDLFQERSTYNLLS